MDEVISESTGRFRFNAWLMTIFATIAVMLALIGVYGLMAYSVRQRTQEIGIRIALGAEPRHVRNSVIVRGMYLALAGVIVGNAGAVALTRVLERFLFGVTPTDMSTYVAASA